jgi:hypothetical protein
VFAEEEAAVVGNIEQFMAISGYRVGKLETFATLDNGLVIRGA